ncbi:NAD(P)/FAD-dependent oxidoreductase [Sphingobium sp. Cam5-1]|uniref:NAD(P)/FAD-dependent oxidoreductase n=1 Tax=Sphingobium sp. Cam5-1 TaxID=2789327 RepID=UPI0018AD2BE1|nr:NAD(P)/FAD-dependent oxidoreductase [Sphingobium sp. Cam5-1]QPI73367.1 NAD(P)/FAD-dependent oxidoreductase [Sphingobium sp. Cam5-1]
MAEELDCLIIGAGPAGLTAAIYLTRFHLKIGIIDAGHSRAALIPRTRNHAGYPGGISGKELLARMREQAAGFGGQVTNMLVEKLSKDGSLFVASIGEEQRTARTILLATGVVNNRPPIAPEIHDVALERGLLRYCPICDGYEVTDRKIAVIGTKGHGLEEALFLRMYSADVTLIAPDGEHALTGEQRGRLEEAGVKMCDGPCEPLCIDGDQIIVPTPQGPVAYDSVYPALGSVTRSELAMMLGADGTEDGCLIVDEHQRTSVPGLYAAGDVAKGLDQISHAMGEGGVAATTIRNDLAKTRGLLR